MYFHFELTEGCFGAEYLCQRASIKNFATTARLWNSCRASEIPLAANLCVILKGLELLHLFLHSLKMQPFCLKQMQFRLKVVKCQIKFTAQFVGRVSPEVWQHVLFYSCKPLQRLFWAWNDSIINSLRILKNPVSHYLSSNVIWLHTARNSTISQDGAGNPWN